MTGVPVLLGARRVRALLDHHGVRPKKTLGQNFVIDPNTIRKVVDVAGLTEHDSVLEIGAGAGSLTLGLARAARRVVAIELDGRLLPVLVDALAGVDNVDVIEADALGLDIGALEVDALVGNLPYGIAAPLVLKVLDEAPRISALTVMTQREVGERLAAPPGSSAYGAPSVMVAYHGAARVAARVSRRAFYPVPNVDSVVVRIDRRPVLPGVAPDRLAPVVHAAFSQRRKTLRNSLAPLAGSLRAAEEALERAGVDPGARPERIGLDGFVALARALG